MMQAATGMTSTATRAGRRALPTWVLDYEQFAPALRIRAKSGALVPFAANEAQRIYREKAGQRNIVLKARQEGISTEIAAQIFHAACTRTGYRAVIIAHERDATNRLKERINVMYQSLPVKPAAKYDSKSELSFPALGNTIYTGTAGGRAFGRGDTISRAHCSEFAFWPNPLEILRGLQEAVPADGRIDIESTPNGYNAFYQMVKQAEAGDGPYRLIFIPWFVHREYRLSRAVPETEWTDDERTCAQKALTHGVVLDGAQVAWRRAKQAALGALFLQEYPEDTQTCFLTSGRPRFDNRKLNEMLARATAPAESSAVPDSQLTLRLWEQPRPGELYVIGADAAEGMAAGDYSAACVLHWASGRKVADLHGRASVFRFADALYALGMRFNAAVIAQERNHPGPAVLARLEEKRYPKLFTHEGKAEPGFVMDSYWRPRVVDALDEAVSSAPETFVDAEEVGEMMAFIINERGKAEASPGAHDDRVMARGIAQLVRTLVRPTERREPEVGRKPMGGQW